MTRSPSSAGVIAFRVRDDQTGYSVPATVIVRGVEPGQFGPVSVPRDRLGRLRVQLPAGHYVYEVSAPDYEPFRADLYSAPGREVPWEVGLSPKMPPPELRPEVLDPQFRPGYALVYSYVVGAVTGKPLANVQIRLKSEQAVTSTNDRGYFALSVPAFNQTIAGVPVPAVDVLTADLPGYKTYLIKYAELTEGSGTFLRLDLEPGQGVAEHGQKPKWMLSPEELKDAQSAEPSYIAGKMPALPGRR